MPSELALIVLTMFAVLGVYYLIEVLFGLLRQNCSARTVTVLVAEDPERVLCGIRAVHERLPESTVVVLGGTVAPLCAQDALSDVTFATPETVGRIVCEQLCEKTNV